MNTVIVATHNLQEKNQDALNSDEEKGVQYTSQQQ